jgi:hypothetical protein
MKSQTTAAVILLTLAWWARAEEPRAMQRELLPLESKLSELRGSLGENHPQVQSLKRQIQAVRELYQVPSDQEARERLSARQLRDEVQQQKRELDDAKGELIRLRDLIQRLEMKPDARAGAGGGAVLRPEGRVPPPADKSIVRVYPLRDFTDGEALLRVITTTIEPQSWTERGGAATAVYFAEGKSLVIKQTGDAHKEIQELLSALRDAKTADRPR